MLKLVLLLVLLLLAARFAYLLVAAVRREIRGGSGPAPRRGVAGEELVRCSSCGVRVPARRSTVDADGRRLCVRCAGGASGRG